MKKSQSTSHLPFTIFYLLGLTPLVHAGPVDGVRQLTDGFREILYILFQFIGDMMGMRSFDQYLFVKILLFTIILLVVYTVIKDNTIFGGTKNKPIQWIISSTVAILSIAYLPNEFIEAILLQYGALAVGVTVFLPLLIFFFFIHKSSVSPFVRRIGWIIYIISFFALWSINRTDLGEANVIYWIAIAVVVLSLIFDKKIHEYFGLSSIRKIRRGMSEDNRLEALRRLKTLEEDFTNGYYKGRERDYDRKKDHLLEIIKKNT
jgi:hypothetical protein